MCTRTAGLSFHLGVQWEEFKKYGGKGVSQFSQILFESLNEKAITNQDSCFNHQVGLKYVSLCIDNYEV